MTENLGRKLTFIVVLIIAAIVSLKLPEKPFRLGLDLQGGTRLVYRFDFDGALQQGLITQRDLDDRQQLLVEFAGIIHGRVDPKGIMDLSLRPEGSDSVVIELPGAAELSTTNAALPLKEALSADGLSVTLDPGTDPELLKAFPQSGGLVRIGDEKIDYGSRAGSVLNSLKRGVQNTTIDAHSPGDTVQLLSSDDLQRMIENVGDLQFMIAVQPGDRELTEIKSDLTKERAKVDKWLDAHPGEPLTTFNRLSLEAGGPTGSLRWHPHLVKRGEPERPVKDRLAALWLPKEEWKFTGKDLEPPMAGHDPLGYPSVNLEFVTEKKNAFGDFSETYLKRGMAIILNGEIITLATIQDKLPGQCEITGGKAKGFTQKEVNELVTLLKSGSLRIKPVLLHKDRVGASLGDDYIKTSFKSSVVALGVIIAFMLIFYRKLGVFSVIGLVLNLLFLMGALAFLKATLTLPGVAGIILTLGMAVDGNILIYERLREEMHRGLKMIQAAKAAFERAAVTIIDSNLTTLIAGVILQYFGTGPIRGFAITLNIGILTTLFTVIVVTEVLVFLDIKRGSANFSMADLFRTPTIPFMSVAKYFIWASWVVIVAGLWLFISLPNRDKLGIDFLGGFRMTVNTEEPMQVGQIHDLVKKIPGTIGEAEVKALTDSGSRDRGYTSFSIIYKLSGESPSQQPDGTAATGENEVTKALSSVLAKGPVEVALAASDSGATANGEIYFESPHAPADVESTLVAGGLAGATVEALPGRPNLFKFSASVEKEKTQDDVVALIKRVFRGQKDSLKKDFTFLTPVPQSAQVGPQVSGELTRNALIAVVLSLFGTMIYLRVRFAEYSYGVAVVISLLHDVLITLGALAVGTWTGVVQSEVDLSMVAAFLTIIGYSQNDTIVIFDRVRENRPKSKAPLSQVLNDSINQTLGRTILTTSTVVLTLIVLFVFNFGSRNVLEGFSFAMLVGVISGAYSTVYIASPVLLWFEKREAKKAGQVVS